MIASIKNYFEELLSNDAQTDNKQHTIELATAVLMIEISLADDHIHDEERRLIHELLLKNFNINTDEINDLVGLAEKEVDHAVSLHDFTRLLNEQLEINDKIKVIENLWRIAFADSVIDKYEEYYIRKVADLMYVSHSDYIKAKLNAKDDN